MKRAIAKIKLAPGNAGWFDPLTNIYLTLSKKECFVYNDQDVSNIRKAIKQNKLVLKEGRLPSPVSEEKKETVKKSIKKQIAQEVVKVEKEYPNFVLVEVAGRMGNYCTSINKSWGYTKEAFISRV